MIYIYNYSNKKEINFFLNNNTQIFDKNKTNINDTILIFVELYSHALYYLGSNNFNNTINNINYSNKKIYIIDENIKFIINKYNKYYIILYSIGETKNLPNNKEILNIKNLIKEVYNIECNKIIISPCDILHSNICTLVYNIKYISYDWVYLNEKISKKKELNFTNEYKDKFIITLNRNINIERFYFCYYLNKNYKDKIYFSYLNNSQKVNSNNNSHLIHNKLCNYNKFIDFSNKLNKNDDNEITYNKFIENMPYTLDSKKIWYKVDNCLQKYINNSYIMVVFETNYSHNTNCLQISEKTYKPLYLGKIFLIFGKKSGILKHLRKNNFKTFSKFINEDYDSDGTYYNRYNNLLKEIDRILSMSKEEIHKLYMDTQSIIKHNYDTLYGKNIPKHKVFDLL